MISIGGICKQTKRAFTLVELLSVIAIIAVLIAVSVPIVGNYVVESRRIADKRTLTVLNDALTRYKTQGGSLSALTAGASIGTVLDLLQTPLTWSGVRHQFLKTGTTYPTRSLSAMGEGAWYRFFGYGTYSDTDEAEIAMGTATSDMPYGKGIGFIQGAVGNASRISVDSTTNAVAFQFNSGNTTIYTGGSIDIIIQSGGNDLRFWSCVDGTDASHAGYINSVSFTNQHVAGVDVSGLLDLESFSCRNNELSSIDISNLTKLTFLDCRENDLTSLNLPQMPNLEYFNCADNNLSGSIDFGVDVPALEYFECGDNPNLSGTIDLSSATALQVANIYRTNVSGVIFGEHPGMMFVSLDDSNVGSLDISSLSTLQGLYCGGNNLTSLDISNNPSLGTLGIDYSLYVAQPSLASVGMLELKVASADYATSPAITTRMVTMNLTHLTPAQLVDYLNNITTTTYGSDVVFFSTQTTDSGFAAAESVAQSRGWMMTEW